jgi:superfamily II DNA or RNA helicase
MKVEVRVDNRIRLLASAVDPETRRDLERAFTHANPSHHRLKKQAQNARSNRKVFGALMAQLKSEPEHIRTWREEGSQLTFPRGGMARVRQALQERCYLLDVVDEREDGDPALGKPPGDHSVALRDFQSNTVDQVLCLEQGILRSPQGSGKTVAILACIAACGVPSLVVVPGGALLDQWVVEARNMFALSRDQVGVLSGKEHRVRAITVAVQKTLWLHAAKFVGRFGFIAADELHLFAARTFIEAIDPFPARYRFGTSAMEKRKDGKEFLLYDHLGDVIIDVDRDVLVEQGLVLDVEVRLVPLETSVPWWEALPGEERPMETMRLIDDLAVDQARTEAIAAVVAEEMKRGQQVLVMSHRVEHCHRLRSALVAYSPQADGLLLGGDNAEFPRTLAGILAKRTLAACGTYQAVGTGFNVPWVGRGVCATPIHTNRYFFEQVMNRVNRAPPGKVDAAVYYPWDVRLFGEAPLKNFLKWGKRVVVRVGDRWVDGREYLERAGDDAS